LRIAGRYRRSIARQRVEQAKPGPFECELEQDRTAAHERSNAGAQREQTAHILRSAGWQQKLSYAL
jgi:hypothetical protein